MFIKLKDNSPMPSCAIWLGDSLIKPAEDSGGKIYDISVPSLFTLNENEIYSNWNPERWRRCDKLKECINLDFSEYTGQDISSLFAEDWGKASEVRFVGSINNSIDFRDAGDGSLLDFTCGNNYMIDNISGRKYTNDSGEQTNFDDEEFEINLKTFYTNSLQIWKNDVLVFDAHVTDDNRFIDNITGTDVPNSQNYQFKKFLDEE